MTSSKEIESNSTPSTETVQAPSSDIWAALNDFLTKEQKPNTLKAFSACLWSAIGIAVIAYFLLRTSKATDIQAPTHEERETLPLIRRVEDLMQLGCVSSTHIRSRIKGGEDQGFCVLWTRLSDNPPAQFDGIGSTVVDLASSDVVQQMEYILSPKTSRAASKATTATKQKASPTSGALTITSKEVYSPQAESVSPDEDLEQACNRKPVWTVTRIATITEHPGCGSYGY
ncbi:hypothetical protein LTR10_010052 [Elasticomyces elasticus]|nr:hypothetical protein LTR10_010052 [Elasticomyces elasticus]KAK4970344.1 hypothetical protein LTR42_008511 [Elasticomyces elasticus]